MALEIVELDVGDRYWSLKVCEEQVVLLKEPKRTNKFEFHKAELGKG
jgi:hypothetical protein